jgi:hypothetical protein
MTAIQQAMTQPQDEAMNFTRTDLTDIEVENHGSIFLFRPLTNAGSEWLNENTDGQWFGNALAVEHRYAFDLAQGAIDDGLKVE